MTSKQKSFLLQLQTEQLELARRQEEETLKLVEESRSEALRLAREQKFELQKQHLIQTENLFEELTKRNEEAENREVSDLNDELENNQNTISALLVNLRRANDELYGARKIAREIVQAINTEEALRQIGLARRKKGLEELKKPVIGFKRVGCIDPAPWSKLFKRRNKKDWDLKMMEDLSKWQGIIQNPEFHPFKNVLEIGTDNWKRVIDDEDEVLSTLKRDYSIPVYNSVTAALLELDEHNSSGRYPVSYAWNFQKSRIASLEEVFSCVAPVIEAFVGPVLPHRVCQSNMKG